MDFTHRARASALYEEFSLGEFGYVAGDQAEILGFRLKNDVKYRNRLLKPDGQGDSVIYRDTVVSRLHS